MIFRSRSCAAEDQPGKVRVRAKNRVHGAIVGNVIAEVSHRRLEEGGDPDRIDTERTDIVEFPVNAGKIPGAISVRIEKTSRVNLIDYCATPPFRLHERL